MTRQSFLDTSLGGAAVGDRVALTGDEAHHARVKRVAVGEEVDVVDGAGVRLHCRVTSLDDDGVGMTVLERTEAATAAVGTVLVQALAKGDRDLQAVEACVEIGVDAVIPWQADRSIVRWRGERAAKAHAKWQAQVRAAVKQSRRDTVPVVEELLDTSALAERVAAVQAAGGLALLLHEEADRPLAATMRQWAQEERGRAGEVLLVVGPEGGIGPEETARLTQAGAVPVSLGANVLRASTAGAVALVLTRAALGAYD